MIFALLKAYWKPISIAFIIASGYWYVSSLQRDNVALKATIEAVKATAKQQVADNALKLKSANILAANAKSSYEAEIKLRDLNRAKLTKDLENEKDNINRLLNTASKLRLDNATRDAVSEIPIATELLTRERADSNTITIITEACKLTTLDYNTLHQAWVDNCKIYGCE